MLGHLTDTGFRKRSGHGRWSEEPMNGGVSSHMNGIPRKSQSGNDVGGRDPFACTMRRQIGHKAKYYISHWPKTDGT